MKKYICSVCGYVHEGDEAPERCPQCKAPKSKFKEVEENQKMWAAEHVIGVAKGVPAEIMDGLKANFEGECTEVGMYLAMARAAHREGYPEIGMYYEKAAFEEADHASRFCEMIGDMVSPSTKKNLEARVAAEYGARALTICTVSDHIRTHELTSAEERQLTFNEMIKIALEAVLIDDESN